ncbi:MAG: ABC transporter substrate-binding protein [Halarchaeum sp.]
MNYVNRRTFLKTSGVVGGASLTGVAGCLGGGGGGGTPTINVGYVVPIENMISLMGIDEIKSQLDNVGDAYELNLSRYSSTPDILNSMAAGELNVGLPAYASFPGAINGNAVPNGMTAVVSGFYDAEPDYFAIPVLSMEDSGIQNPEDLDGAKIGVNATGTGVHAIIYRMLQKVGIDSENDVDFVEIGFPAMGSALREGKIDAGIFVSTFGNAERNKGGVQTVFDSQDAWEQPYPFTFLVAKNDFIDENEDGLRAWIADYVQMINYSYDNRDTVVSLASEEFDVPEALLSSFYLTQDDYYRPKDGHLDVDALQHTTDALTEMGFLEKSPTMSDYVTNEYLPE